MTKLASLFDTIDLFYGMPFADVELLSGYFQVLDKKQSDVLFREGEAGDALYIVLDGKVQVSKLADGADHPVSVENAGKVLGEMALLDGEARSATCTMLKAGSVAIMTRDAFARLEKEHPAVALRFLKLVVKLVSRRLRMTTGRLAQFT